MAFAQSFHLVATLAFVLGSALVSGRLLMLARRTRQQPELLLGSAILGTAVLGYGVLIGVVIVQGVDQSAASATPLTIALTAAGRSLHAVGVSCFLLFILRVFHPSDRWAKGLAAVAALLLWGGMVWGGMEGAFRSQNALTPAWWCEYLVIWTYPVWLGLESLRYWRMLRRRVSLGLADAMVANRFALWGASSIGSAIAIWSASVPFFLLDQPQLLEQTTPAIRVITALAGIASISCSYLAFLPPAWYARRFGAQTERADAEMA